MNKKAILAVVVVVAAIAIVASVKKSEVSEDVKIGAVAPLTGWGAYWGEGYVKGIELAVDEIKSAGGSIDVVIEDGGTEAQKSVGAAQKLINIDKVDALAVEFTGPSSAISPISAEKKIPLIYDSLVKKFVDENPYAFKMYFDVGQQCLIAARYLAEHGYKNIGGFSVNLDFAPECEASLNKIAQEKGVKVGVYKFNADLTDFRTLIAKMKSDGIDAVIPVFYEDHAVSFFKQKHDLGFRAQVFTGIGVPDGLTEKVRSSVPRASIEGVLTYDQPISEEFRTRLAKKYPSITEKDYVPAAYGYDEIMYLYPAMSKCAKGDASCVVAKVKEDAHIGVLQSSGFGEDRVFDMKPVYYKYTGGKLEEFSLTR